MKKDIRDHDFFKLDHRPGGKFYFNGVRVISDQIDLDGLELVWDTLLSVIREDVPGDIVEFGCYVGTTSLVIRKLLDEYNESDIRAFHVYDSFEGLPEKTAQDSSPTGIDFTAGKLFVSKKEFIHQFQSTGFEQPTIHKGWFHELTTAEVPEHIAFAFLDGDFYGSIIDSLRLVWPRMVGGGKLVVDDYEREALPGVSRALHDFFQAKPVKIEQRGTRAIINVSAY